MAFPLKRLMKNLLGIATECIDQFAEQKNAPRLAAIVGGEAVIMHGIPRTTLDLDILFFCEAEENNTDSHVKQLRVHS